MITIESHNLTVIPGFGVASGKAKDSPFGAGTISLQKPIFKALGLNLEAMFNGTINGEFACQKVSLTKIDHHFKQVKWHSRFPAEDFGLIKCSLKYQENTYKAFIYQPFKETKIRYFQAGNVLEILAEPIANLNYYKTVTLKIPTGYLSLK